MGYKIGIDVGGTHTDAVIVSDKNEIVAADKTNTTPDPTDGIVESLDLVLKSSGVDVDEISHVMIGTTHCINAVVERKNLARVAVIRICKPAGQSIPPMYGWPDSLKSAVGATYWLVGGGYDYDGRKIGEFRDSEVRSVVREALEKGFNSFAVTGIFSPVIPDEELQVAEIIDSMSDGRAHVSVSHKIGRIGLLERENATILNAALTNVARSATNAIEEACRKRGIYGKLYFSQNDGMLMSVDYARQYPIFTIASGPTNSFRGASFLTGLRQAIVVDIGGTTLLAGMLVNGFPRQSAAWVEVGGVRTNFRMPDLVSIGCGGGTIVRFNDGRLTLGPDSVGYELERRALSWGGDLLTTTDVAVGLGYARIEGAKLVTDWIRDFDIKILVDAREMILRYLQEAVDQVKTTKEPLPMILVGGGGIIIPEDRYKSINGVSEVIRPVLFQYANALGAAVAEVGGEIEKVFSLDSGLTRQEALEQAKKLAVQEAVKAGAKSETVEVVDIDETFLAYLPSNAVKIRVKAAGKL
ncbi:Acetophenone carboxylase gamma subunit [archaeon HR01]|nr:Acetophenone carboxylase gamma subunit [archaeon HR01]